MGESAYSPFQISALGVGHCCSGAGCPSGTVSALLPADLPRQEALVFRREAHRLSEYGRHEVCGLGEELDRQSPDRDYAFGHLGPGDRGIERAWIRMPLGERDWHHILKMCQIL